MTDAILNVGLGSYPGAKYSATLEAHLVSLRKVEAMKVIGSWGCALYVEFMLDAQEPTLVVQLWDIPANFEVKCTELCDAIGQWCIAAEIYPPHFSPTIHKLIGPRAAEFGVFDPSMFLSPSRDIR